MYNNQISHYNDGDNMEVAGLAGTSTISLTLIKGETND
jgi:hypothetical protein